MLLQHLNRHQRAEPKTVAAAEGHPAHAGNVLNVHDVFGVPESGPPPNQEVGAARDNPCLLPMALQHAYCLPKCMSLQVLETLHAYLVISTGRECREGKRPMSTRITLR